MKRLKFSPESLDSVKDYVNENEWPVKLSHSQLKLLALLELKA